MKKRYITKDTSGAFFDPHRAIVPIMKRHSGCTELIGTGFFISKFGHFATAKHVLFQRDRFDPEPGLHILHFVEGDGEHEKLLVREITRISFSETADVAICASDFHIENKTQQPLTNKQPNLNLEIPTNGTSVHTYAYPKASQYFDQAKDSKIVADFHDGEILNYSEIARDRVVVNWPHFELSFEGGGRTSGGPIFDNIGCIFGIYCVDGLGSSYAGRVLDLLPLRVPFWPGSTLENEPYLAQLIESGHVFSRNRVRTAGDNYKVFAN